MEAFSLCEMKPAGCWYLGLPSPSTPEGEADDSSPASVSTRLAAEAGTSSSGDVSANMSPSSAPKSPSHASGCRMLIEPRKRSNPPPPRKSSNISHEFGRAAKRKRVSQIAQMISEEAAWGMDNTSITHRRSFGGLMQSPQLRSPSLSSPIRFSGHLDVSAHTRKRLEDYLSPKMKKTCQWRDENELATLLNGTNISQC